MKKIILMLIVLSLSFAAFATIGMTVQGAVSFGYFSMESIKGSSENFMFNDSVKRVRTFGVGMDTGVEYETPNHLVLYLDINVFNPNDIYYKEGRYAEYLLKDDLRKQGYYNFAFTFGSFGGGAGYKFDLSPVHLIVGGGLFYNTFIYSYSHFLSKNMKVSYNIIGVDALVEARYKINRLVGINLSARPQLGIYEYAKAETSDSATYAPVTERVEGFIATFALPVALGVSFSF